LSSHSLWELCRSAALAPDYIACGPIWPTTTKDMPWLPQGLDNLAWWAHMSPAPVVGIGGILDPDQLRAVAAAGAGGGCVVRGLGEAPAQSLPGLLGAWRAGRLARDGAASPGAAPSQGIACGWPHPSLPQVLHPQP
jgi:hydroxymethylpyrimidine kinase / phosphomethylpyrimidine kinase / thiamine-phosphate diphosphorylase